jgi:hypothetical protein
MDERGRGRVQSYEDGADLGEARYDLVVSQQVREEPYKGGAARLPGSRSVHGQVQGVDVLGLFNRRLTLILDDGRRLDFQFENSSGSIIANSGIYSAAD